jgi:hypothetical protein
MKTEPVPEDAKDTLYKVKKLLEESNEIVDRIKSLKAERAQLQPLPGSLRRRMIKCGKRTVGVETDNCTARTVILRRQNAGENGNIYRWRI